ncbi:MAG: hemerythrin domain-containing protein [Chitinophagaceae bacterium]
MEKPKPLKRSNEIAPLSREHHEGLLLVWKIRKGITNGTSVKTISSYIKWFWENYLLNHFKKEETVLIEYVPVENKHVKQMFEEHRVIVDKIAEIENQPNEKLLLEFSTLLEAHIRFEERVLFNEIEQILSAEQLEKLGEILNEDEKSKASWDDEFWLKK